MISNIADMAVVNGDTRTILHQNSAAAGRFHLQVTERNIRAVLDRQKWLIEQR